MTRSGIVMPTYDAPDDEGAASLLAEHHPGGVRCVDAQAIARFGLARVEVAARRGWTAAILAVIVLWGVFVAEYDSQFHHTDAHASFWSIYR